MLLRYVWTYILSFQVPTAVVRQLDHNNNNIIIMNRDRPLTDRYYWYHTHPCTYVVDWMHTHTQVANRRYIIGVHAMHGRMHPN